MAMINIEAEFDLQDLMDEIMRQTEPCVILDMILDSMDHDREYAQKAGILTRHILDRIEKDTAVPEDEPGETVGRF